MASSDYVMLAEEQLRLFAETVARVAITRQPHASIRAYVVKERAACAGRRRQLRNASDVE